ncbi:HAMP domain-containing protein [Patescibacteria group bacterium]|nr:HAMP domain-containing protein [Patescibacteria group bacterium]
MTIQKTILFNIAFPIIIVGLFVMVIFTALNYGNLTIEVYIVSILVSIFIFLFGFAIGQKFASPVRQLLDTVERLSKGELKSRVYLETKDEFGELAKAFNKIAEDLQKSQMATQEAEGIADVRIRAKTQELEEMVNDLEEKVKNRAQELQRMIKESDALQNLVKSRETEVINLKKEIKQINESSVEREKHISSIKKSGVDMDIKKTG